MSTPKLLLALFLGTTLFACRFIPHPANFTPFLALVLFVGHQFRGSPFFIITPLAALFASDLIMGLYAGWFFVYLGFAVVSLLGVGLQLRVLSLLTRATYASVAFFGISNFGVWYTSLQYPKTIDGLVACYVAAIPFFHRTLISTLLYSAIIFGISAIAIRTFQAETAGK